MNVDLTRALRLLDHGLALTIGDVAEAVGCSHGHACKVVSAMRGAGLVVPVPGPRAATSRIRGRQVGSAAPLWVAARWA